MNKKALLIAGGLAVLLVLWLASGHLGRDSAGAPPESQRTSAPPFLVQAEVRRAEPVVRELILQGQTTPNRQVTLRAETSGPVEEVLVERGARVARGDVLVRIAQAERASRLRQARARVNQLEAEYEAAQSLSREGFQSENAARQILAQLEQARADLQAAQVELENLTISAPFDGVVNERYVEVGDYVSPGNEVAMVVEAQPLLVRVHVPQQEIARLAPDSPVQVRPLRGEPIDGRIRYISAVAAPGTRTFAVDVEIPNPGALRAGVSTEVRIALERAQAHFLSPSLLSLDADGVLGVKTVDAEERVRFHPVQLVRSEPQGVWVDGLPEQARIITVGQGFVAPGQPVRVKLAEAADTADGTRSQ